jgi:hypothetical protein
MFEDLVEVEAVEEEVVADVLCHYGEVTAQVTVVVQYTESRIL